MLICDCDIKRWTPRLQFSERVIHGGPKNVAVLFYIQLYSPYMMVEKNNQSIKTTQVKQ